jgi:hypothetical protein
MLISVDLHTNLGHCLPSDTSILSHNLRARLVHRKNVGKTKEYSSYSFSHCSSVWNTGTSTKLSSGMATKPALLEEWKNPLSANGNFPAALARVWLRVRALIKLVELSFRATVHHMLLVGPSSMLYLIYTYQICKKEKYLLLILI